MHTIVTNGVISQIKFFKLHLIIVKDERLTFLVYKALERAIIALIPSLNDCRFNVLEFLTFLLSKSSLNNLAFSTIITFHSIFSLTIGSFTRVMAASVEQISVKLIFKQLSDRITYATSCLHGHLRL
jgi:hypothetical protein